MMMGDGSLCVDGMMKRGPILVVFPRKPKPKPKPQMVHITGENGFLFFGLLAVQLQLHKAETKKMQGFREYAAYSNFLQ